MWLSPTAGVLGLLHWVDDLLILGSSLKALEALKGRILTSFKGRDLGVDPEGYLGIKLERNRSKGTLKISVPTLVEALLEKTGMLDSKAQEVPMSPSVELATQLPTDVLLENPTPYQEAVGSLLYMATVCRPDLSLAVSVLAKAMSAPTKRHWGMLKAALRYLAGTRALGLVYSTHGNSQCLGYVDSDYAGDRDKRKSRTGFVYVLGGAAISWQSKLQPLVATSTAEAEYIAAFTAGKEGVWLRRVLCEFLPDHSKQPLTLRCDNQAALAMAGNTTDSNRTKHMDVRFHWLREAIGSGALSMEYVPTQDNAADMFTKPLDATKFKRCRELIGMR